MSNRKRLPADPVPELNLDTSASSASTSENAQPSLCVLLLMAGPKYDLEWEFGDRLAGLSSFSFGYVLTTSSFDGITRLSNFKVHSIDVGNKWGATIKLQYFLAALKLFRNESSNGSSIDAVITYDPVFSGIIGLILSKIWRAKLICEINGDYTSAVNYNYIASRWQRKFRKYVITSVARFVLRNTDGMKLLFDEQFSRLKLRQKEVQQVERFPDFVMVSAFANRGEEKTVLLLGFPAYVKGVDIAIRAFRGIEREYPEWKLVIMGHYPEREELNSLIGESKQIQIQKAVLHRDVIDHVGRCAIMLLPSRTEAMGRVLVEAMSASKPIIATDIDGIPNVVENEVNGLLIPPNDVPATEAALMTLMDDQDLRAHYGRAGAAKAQAEFVEKVYFAKYEDFLLSVVPKNK